MAKEKIIGIDLGTSNSAASVYEGGRPTIIPSAEGQTLSGKAFPSYVAFTKDGQVLVGEPARRQAVANPEGTIFGAKRNMGTDYKYRFQGKEYTPQQISAFILQKIKRDAEAFLGGEVKKAVITVPAYFNDNQRQATKDAGTIAGLEVVRLINEPTAAAFAYGLDKVEQELKVMVFDIGAGTLDVTIMDLHKGVGKVISTSGDTKLGGLDMDNILIDYIANEFKKETGLDVRNDRMAIQRIREAAEKAKIELSNTLATDINLPYLTADSSGPKHLTMSIRRATLEELINPILERCRGPIDQALKDAGLSAREIAKIIMVGGPTRMPSVQAFLEEYVGRKAERGVDPMECVAVGAAIQGAILAGDLQDKELLLLDVTPLSLGIETLGGVSTALIARNTTIPTRKSQVFTTAADGQTAVDVHVLQGERPMATDNTSLGSFQLAGIPPAPRGLPQIEVTFDIDANGILSVSAKDKGTGKEQSIKISAPNKLSKDEIDNLVRKAEEFAEADRQAKELAETANQADNLVYSIEKNLKEHGDKIGEEDRKAIESKAAALREELKSASKSVVSLKKAMDELEKSSYKLAEILYKQSQAGSGQPGAPGAEAGPEAPAGPQAGAGEPEPGQGPVIDAEFKEDK
ncbi:MAG TPA: molecular chaperone DnaK [bacterium]|nr:molecular chaperone DnaK [bacterium]HNS48213.1 molecular chaperone DnaK [bacterium]